MPALAILALALWSMRVDGGAPAVAGGSPSEVELSPSEGFKNVLVSEGAIQLHKLKLALGEPVCAEVCVEERDFSNILEILAERCVRLSPEELAQAREYDADQHGHVLAALADECRVLTDTFDQQDETVEDNETWRDAAQAAKATLESVAEFDVD
jgi:hypothetical protein